MTRTALLRAAVAPLLAAVLSLAPVSAIASAHAVPVAAAPVDDATDPERPVRIDVGRFEPRAVTPGALVTVTGTLTNTGSSAITDLSVRLQRGNVVTTRDELAASAGIPTPPTRCSQPSRPYRGNWPPAGHSTSATPSPPTTSAWTVTASTRCCSTSTAL